MNKKIILSLGSALLLTSSLLASDVKVQSQDTATYKNSTYMQNERHSRGNFNFISTVMKLKLSDEQKAKIKDIMKQSIQNMPKPYDAFSENSFDKELFIKLSKQREDSKLESKAVMMESVYNVLNAAQKKELKEKLQKVCMDKKFK